MFTFKEEFKRYGEDYIPYGIEIDAASHLWHRHIRPDGRGMAIAAPGCKYILRVPSAEKYTVDYLFGFNHFTDSVGMTAFFGYDKSTHSGYELILCWDRNAESVTVTLDRLEYDRTVGSENFTVPCGKFPDKEGFTRVRLSALGDHVTLLIDGCDEVRLDVTSTLGAVGFSRPNFVGEIVYGEVEYRADIAVTEQPPVKVTVPLLEGGTMPLTVEYQLITASGEKYLKATLDGGPQYRPQYEYYDPEGKRGQYVVEAWYMTRPYVAFSGEKFYLSMDSINTSDGLHWKGILDVYLGMVDFPVTVTYPVSGDCSGYSFGYEECRIKGFVMQSGAAEYNFSKEGEYIGRTTMPDTFELVSPEDKYAVSMIKDSVYEADVVRAHFARNHYFADGEEISFTLFKGTEKKYLSFKAELQDIYGDKMEDIILDGEGAFTHAPLPVGLYRIFYTVYYGDSILRELDVVFEVFDKTGERCAPLESGLPVLFSTPNEQKYLDRDKFDPWNPGRVSNSEHFYSISSFLSYIGERKRIWEVIKLFGRRWYAWLTDRIYGSDEAASYDKHPEVVKNADYLAYHHDYMAGSYMYNCGKLTLPAIEDFLDSHEGARELVNHRRDEPYTRDVHYRFMISYGREWSDYLVEVAKEARRAFVSEIKKLNPDIKLSGYGPFAIYAAQLRSYSLLEYYAFPTGDELTEYYFSGFAQFEDYPASCAYQTYRGPFGVGPTLAKIPSFVFYPEQYKGGPGGCIDGHVKHANPPLGRYDMPIWFNVSLLRDYMYNTAVKSKDGYRFWDTYGFMHADHPEQNDDYFIRKWKYARRHKPESVLRSPIFIAEFPKEESGYEVDFTTHTNWRVFYNVSEEGVAHLYETTRLRGLPMGAYALWDALDSISPDEVDMLVIPSTVGVAKERLDRIRELYAAGVSLFAVSRIDGLEDLFGVKYAPKSARMIELSAGDRSEVIYPYTDTFNYESDGAETVLWASGNPVYFTYGRTALLNVCAYSVGRTHFREHPYLGRATNSGLYYDVTEQLLKRLTSPLAVADDECGITLVRDIGGRDVLVAIDYTPHDQSKIYEARNYTVKLNADYKDARSLDGSPLARLVSPEGRLDAVVLTLRQHESCLIELIK